jgi:hypothetical protein
MLAGRRLVGLGLSAWPHHRNLRNRPPTPSKGRSSNETIGTKTTFMIFYFCSLWVEFNGRTLRVPVPCLYLLFPRRH